MENYTITEQCELPSKGLIYPTPIESKITLRSMTTQDEMIRLSPSEYPNKTICDIIERCIVSEKPKISVYDMCLGDFNYLLHKLRTVTYGPEYKLLVVCPVCKNAQETVCNLDKLEVLTYDNSLEDQKFIELPLSKKKIELRFQTPRDADSITTRKRDWKKKSPDTKADPEILFTLASYIETIDGQKVPESKIEMFLRELPMKDANYLKNKGELYNRSIGLNTNFTTTCSECGFEMMSTFRFSSEFFNPTE